jgi:hypothetical protein
MAWGEPLGLDELMIVNPGLPPRHPVTWRGNSTLYRLPRTPQPPLGDVYLGADGNLYQAVVRQRSPTRRCRVNRRSPAQCRCGFRCRRCRGLR